MDRQGLLRAIYESIDWHRLYEALPGITREQVDELFRAFRQSLGEPPEARKELLAQLIGAEAYLYCDGASLGNPGPAGVGMVLRTTAGEAALAWGAPIGKATNNAAEYQAVIEGLKKALELEVVRIRIFSDSELLVRQLQGTYKVKNAGLRPLHAQVVALLGGFQAWAVHHVPREENAQADDLAAKHAREQASGQRGPSQR